MLRGRLLARLAMAVALFFSAVPQLWAFPDKEISGIQGGPPFDFGLTDSATSFFLKDNRIMLVTYGQKLARVDLAYYALTAEQPFDITTDDDDDNDSPFKGAAYLSSTDEVLVTQERGHALLFSLSDTTLEPIDITIAEGKALGPVAIDDNDTFAYIANNTDHSIHVLNLGTLEVDVTIPVEMPPQTAFSYTAAVYNSGDTKFYFSTDKGGVVALTLGGTAASIINVDVTNGDPLEGISVTPNNQFVYTNNTTSTELVKIIAATGVVDNEIELTKNASLIDVVATSVTNPSATYVYVAGGDGVSVVDAVTDQVLNMVEGSTEDPIPTTAAPKKLVASTDGYVYMSLVTTSVGIISANPWVSVKSVAYSSGGTSLGAGDTVTITFMPNEDVTYEFRSGGDIDQSGQLLSDINGNTSGSAAADADLGVEIPYDDNKDLFKEGDNDVFVFVTDGDNDVGRHAANVVVDTPPDIVTLRSTGFGNERIYVTFDRLTADDMSHYNVYVDTDPIAILTKAEIAVSPNQPGSGDTVEAEIGGLTNGVIYYMAVEGVDSAGNVSPQRANTLPDGSLAFAIPQDTVGPAGLSGETGCMLIPRETHNMPWGMCLLFITTTIILLISRAAARNGWRALTTGTSAPVPRACAAGAACGRLARSTRGAPPAIFFLIITIMMITSMVSTAHAYKEKQSPQWWSFELKAGFWMPRASRTKLFFDTCCNVVIKAEGGLLIHGRYGIEQGVGIMWKDGNAVGVDTGETSEDRFSFVMVPMDTSFAWRLDYWDWRYIVPYFKAGIDYVYFRENVKGNTTQGLKFGTHGVAGIQLPLGEYSDDVAALDAEYGLNDISFTMEGRYQWIDDFGSRGLDLTGWIFSAGFLFTF